VFTPSAFCCGQDKSALPSNNEIYGYPTTPRDSEEKGGVTDRVKIIGLWYQKRAFIDGKMPTFLKAD
jgi:hypothetical protein